MAAVTGSSRQSPPEVVEIAGPGLVGDDPRDEEQRRLEQRVVEQVERAGLAAVDDIEAEARDHQPEVARRRVGE
jgi:hypothetical protein